MGLYFNIISIFLFYNFPIFSKNLLKEYLNCFNLILLFNILSIFSKEKWKPNFKYFFQYVY
jgi:hypothetical protein